MTRTIDLIGFMVNRQKYNNAQKRPIETTFGRTLANR